MIKWVVLMIIGVACLIVSIWRLDKFEKHPFIYGGAIAIGVILASAGLIGIRMMA